MVLLYSAGEETKPRSGFSPTEPDLTWEASGHRYTHYSCFSLGKEALQRSAIPAAAGWREEEGATAGSRQAFAVPQEAGGTDEAEGGAGRFQEPSVVVGSWIAAG